MFFPRQKSPLLASRYKPTWNPHGKRGQWSNSTGPKFLKLPEGIASGRINNQWSTYGTIKSPVYHGFPIISSIYKSIFGRFPMFDDGRMARRLRPRSKSQSYSGRAPQPSPSGPPKSPQPWRWFCIAEHMVFLISMDSVVQWQSICWIWQFICFLLENLWIHEKAQL